MSKLRLIAASLCLLLPAAAADAADCQAFIKSFINSSAPASSVLQGRLATMNNKGVVSYSLFNLQYTPGIIREGVPQPGRFTNARGEFGDNIAQLFSDRFAGDQPFNVAQWDAIGIEILDALGNQTAITLRSHNNAKAILMPSCEEGGFMLAETLDVKYTFYLSK
jgi:hypothetical protein